MFYVFRTKSSIYYCSCFWIVNAYFAMNTKDYGLHNRRPGVATKAANLGINNILFKKHVSWNSEKVNDGYSHENLDLLLLVSKHLGLWHIFSCPSS